MNFASILASSARPTTRNLLPHNLWRTTTRSVSSSPYGRTHVWKHRQRKLPPPFVPQFPQRVTRADGSTFTQYTTSPRSEVLLTRDTTNNPLWNASKWVAESEDEDEVTGRLGRFNRRFGDLGGFDMDMEFLNEGKVAKEEEKGDKKPKE